MTICILFNGCISQDYTEKQNICVHISTHICKQIYYKKSAHLIMKTGKSHDLPSASWKPRKAGGESQRADGVDSCLDLKTENHKPEVPRLGDIYSVQTLRQRQQEPTLPLLFCFLQPLQ